MTSKLWMLLAVFSFCVMAVAIKEIGSEVDSFQIIFYRSLVGLLTVMLFFRKQLGRPSIGMIKDHLFRNVFHLLGQYGWIIGIVFLPLAEVTAIEFSVPILVLLIAGFFLKERFTWMKFISIALGFMGVLIILRPGSGLISQYSLLVLLSAVSYAIAHTSTKQLTQRYSAIDMVLMMCLIQLPLSFDLSIHHLAFPTMENTIYLLLIGIAAMAARFSMAKAMEQEDVSSIISLDYFRLPLLIAISVLVYQENFDPFYLLGGTLIFIGNFNQKRKKRLA